MEFRDGGWQLTVAGKSMTPPQIAADLCQALECAPGLTDIAARLADLDVEGVEKELIFPQRLFGLFMFGKMMNRPETFAAYNEHIAEACAAGQGPPVSGDGAQLLGPGTGQGLGGPLQGARARAA